MVFGGAAMAGIGQRALDISPDGRQVVYVGLVGSVPHLVLRSLDDFSSRILPETEGAYGPFFSSDGEWIGFLADDQLKRVSVEGGRAQSLHQASSSNTGGWNPDDRIAIMTKDNRVPLIVSPNGEVLYEWEVSGAQDRMAMPRWLPGGEWLLVTCVLPVHVCATSTRTHETRHLVLGGEATTELSEGSALYGSSAMYLEPGYLLYGAPDGRGINGVRFDVDRLAVTSEPIAVLENVRTESGGALQYAISPSGDLVYSEGEDASVAYLVWRDLEGGVDTLPFPPRRYEAFHMSTDRSRLAIRVVPAVGPVELRLIDLETGRDRSWVDERGWIGAGTLFPGGFAGPNELLVTAVSDSIRIFRIDWGREYGGDLLWTGLGIGWLEGIARDGRLLLHVLPETGPGGGYLALEDLENLSQIQSGDRTLPEPLVPSEGEQYLSDFSPNGEWLTYTSLEGGAGNVYALRMTNPEQPILVSQGGGEVPRWSPQNDGFFYRNHRNWYWVSLTDDEDEPFADPVLAFQDDYLNIAGPEHEVSSDGQRLLLLKGSGGGTTTSLNLIRNWVVELARLIGTAG
jgi:hypothetical protein